MSHLALVHRSPLTRWHTPNHRSSVVPVSIMTSSSGTLPPSRPASGIPTDGGTRTPRRVQWAGHDDVWVDDHSPRPSIHELDVTGRDVCSCLLVILFQQS